ncbi:MAG TPA: hypothetical protein VH969_11155 [Actinophytocola sp.]|uniref:effector-associated constant component EACC1 n=1 Tax=Actinophytocola sp. TaxID=1872138 RepID=UPI002F94021D
MSADGTRELSIRLTGELADEFREFLTAQAFRIPEGHARSVVAEVVVATAANPAAWTTLGGAVVAFLRRHRGKAHRFEVEGKSVSIEGYSAKEARRLANDLLGMSRSRGN